MLQRHRRSTQVDHFGTLAAHPLRPPKPRLAPDGKPSGSLGTRPVKAAMAPCAQAVTACGNPCRRCDTIASRADRRKYLAPRLGADMLSDFRQETPAGLAGTARATRSIRPLWVTNPTVGRPGTSAFQGGRARRDSSN